MGTVIAICLLSPKNLFSQQLHQSVYARAHYHLGAHTSTRTAWLPSYVLSLVAEAQTLTSTDPVSLIVSRMSQKLGLDDDSLRLGGGFNMLVVESPLFMLSMLDHFMSYNVVGWWKWVSQERTLVA